MKKKEGLSENPEQSGSTPEKAAAPRRGALKRLAAGGAAAGILAALPSRWTRPVVESVMLPAHAQTSEPGEPDGVFFAASQPTDSRSILDWFVPAAHAVVVPDCQIGSGCATLADGEITLFLRLTDGKSIPSCYSGMGGVGDTVALSPQNGINILCNKTVDIVSLEGTAPNRTLTLSNGAGQSVLQETSGDCDCGSILIPL